MPAAAPAIPKTSQTPATPAPASSPPSSPGRSPASDSAPPPSITLPEGRTGATWDRLRGDLRKAANIEPPPDRKPPEPAANPDPKPQAQVPITQQKSGTPAKPAAQAKPVEPAADPEESGQPVTGQPPTETKGKASPWKLMEQFKARAVEANSRVLALEKELEETRKRALPEEKWQETQARLKEAEDHRRFHDYQNSEEFKTKYEVPYQKAWQRALSSLKSITGTDEAGNVKPFTGADMAHLCNMDGPAARKLARETWGEDAAPDIMEARGKIVDTHGAMKEALEEAKTHGAERERQQIEERKGEFQKTFGMVRDAFQQAHEAILKHPEHGKWLNPTDGDEEGNAALEKGYAFARDAFAARPLDPNLSPEQRVLAAKKQAALIARGAAYTRLTKANAKQAARIAELEEKLKGYDGSVPGNGAPNGGVPGNEPQGDAKSRMFGALRKLAS